MKSETLRMACLLVPATDTIWNGHTVAEAIREEVVGNLPSAQVRMGENISGALAESAKRLNATAAIRTIEFTVKGEGAVSTLRKIASNAKGVFGRFADPAASNIAVGHLHVVDAREGDTMAMVCDRRKADIDADAFFDWWFNHHVPLGQRLCGGRLPFAAEMIHVDRDLSREACGLAGLNWRPLDGYESLVSDRESLDAFFADQDIQQGLAADEAGGSIDPGSITSAFLSIRNL